MNKDLFKQTLKSNWIVGVIIFAVMLMYISVILSMYDPDSLDSLNQMMEMLPKELIAAMGFEDFGNTLTSYLGNYYYNFIAVMFPMIYTIIVSNRLVAKHVDNGSMAYLLSTPNSRKKIVTTQALYLLSSIAILLGLVTLSGIAVSEMMFPGEIEVKTFLMINLVTLLTIFSISGISFFFSCLFNESKYSLSFGGGIPIAFFVINMLANVGDKSAWLKNFTILTFLNPDKIIEGGSFVTISILSLSIITVVSYIAGVVTFDRRNLPL